MRRFIEQKLQPVVRRLGFRTAEFAWSRYTRWLARANGVELVERRLIPPLGHFSLVRFRKIEAAWSTQTASCNRVVMKRHVTL
jgi:phosphatidylethanolamine/phosphatidyl-N-methylethanolamine N-methyltransferase